MQADPDDNDLLMPKKYCLPSPKKNVTSSSKGKRTPCKVPGSPKVSSSESAFSLSQGKSSKASTSAKKAAPRCVGKDVSAQKVKKEKGKAQLGHENDDGLKMDNNGTNEQLCITSTEQVI